MSFLVTKQNKKVSGNTFFIQYLSLILIIIVFTTGAFLRGSKVTPAVAEEIEVIEKKENKDPEIVKTPLSTIKYDNLFLDENTELNSDIAEALVTFLSNHDVEGEIVLGPKSESENDFNTTLGRVITLASYLEKKNIPRNSWRVLASDLPLEAQAVVKLVGVKEVHEHL